MLAWTRALGPRPTWPVPGCLAEDVSLLRGRLAPSGKNRVPPVHLLSPATTNPSPRPSVVSLPRERVLCPTRCRSSRVPGGLQVGPLPATGRSERVSAPCPGKREVLGLSGQSLGRSSLSCLQGREPRCSPGVEVGRVPCAVLEQGEGSECMRGAAPLRPGARGLG